MSRTNYAKCCCAVNLATGSRGALGTGKAGGPEGSKNAVGASVQLEESGILLGRDGKRVTGVFGAVHSFAIPMTRRIKA